MNDRSLWNRRATRGRLNFTRQLVPIHRYSPLFTAIHRYSPSTTGSNRTLHRRIWFTTTARYNNATSLETSLETQRVSVESGTRDESRDAEIIGMSFAKIRNSLLPGFFRSRRPFSGSLTCFLPTAKFNSYPPPDRAIPPSRVRPGSPVSGLSALPPTISERSQTACAAVKTAISLCAQFRHAE